MVEVAVHMPVTRPGKAPWVTIYAGKVEHTHYVDLDGRWVEIERVDEFGRSAAWEHRGWP